MSDEEKSIEEIIAELESIEKKKGDDTDSVEHDETVQMDASAIEDEHEHPPEEPAEQLEKLTLEQKDDELSLEKPLEDRPTEVLPEEEPPEIILDDKTFSEVPTEQVIEDPPREELVLEESVDEGPQAAPSEEILEESHEKLVLEELVEEGPQDASSEKILADAPREELVLDEIVEEPPEAIFEEAPSEELILDEPFEEKPLEKPPEEVFGEEPHEELVFEKPVEDELPGIAPDELRVSDIQEEPMSEPSSEKMFAAVEEESPPEGPPPDEYGDEPPDEPPLPPEISKPPRVSRMTVLLGLLLIALIGVAYFVWPTMYEYKTTTIKGNTYEVRVNRLTSVKEYNVMEEWQTMPPSEKSIYRARIKVPSKDTKTAAKTDFEKARKLAQERAKAKALAKAKAKETSSLEKPKTVTVKTVEKQPEEVKVTIAKKEPVKAVTESTPTEPIKATKEVTVAASIPSAKPAPTQEPSKTVPAAEKKAEEPKVMVLVKKETPKPEKKGGYAIQIASMRFGEFAEELVEALGSKGFDGHIDTIKSKRGGVWHTVLIGHFADKGQARAFMKEKKITRNYPGCFIRKLYDR
jgi:cell division septation protein DedD